MSALDRVDKVKRLLTKAAFIAPMVSVYLFSRGDMVEPGVYFSVVALALLSGLAIDSLRNVERLENACEEAQKQANMYKAQCEDKDKGLHQMRACYNFMMENHAAERFGVSHEDYMQWSFGAVDEMTPEGRAIMEAHEAKRAKEKQS